MKHVPINIHTLITPYLRLDHDTLVPSRPGWRLMCIADYELDRQLLPAELLHAMQITFPALQAKLYFEDVAGALACDAHSWDDYLRTLRRSNWVPHVVVIEADEQWVLYTDPDQSTLALSPSGFAALHAVAVAQGLDLLQMVLASWGYTQTEDQGLNKQDLINAFHGTALQSAQPILPS